jgi:GT2 family glycosyltransferase
MEESAPQQAKITVLILSYNSAESLRRSLPALEASQGRERIEIIVVDCGSSDGSPTLDRDFPGITILRLERNFGATKALNIGMRTAAADYVLFLAPEVIVEPNTVMALALRLDAEESAGAVCPLLVDEAGQPRTTYSRLPSPAGMGLLWLEPESLPHTEVDPAAEAVAVEYPGRTAVAARKYFIKAINWFDDRYGEFGSDIELAFQLWRSKRKILVIPSIRATVIEGEPLEFDMAALATLSGDRAHGISVFLSKHFGWFAGISFTVKAVFGTLGRLLTFQQPGFQFRVLSAVLSGKKIDGSQRTL